jgi:hypothetical protein
MRRCAELASHFQYLGRRKRMLISMVSHSIPHIYIYIYIYIYICVCVYVYNSTIDSPLPWFLKKKLSFAGYLIPKGWKVLVWNRGVHMDPENYSNPKDFDPSRWDVSSIYIYIYIYRRTCLHQFIFIHSASTFCLHVLILYLLEFCVELYTQSWELPSFWSRK